jgi:hypothetical protein
MVWIWQTNSTITKQRAGSNEINSGFGRMKSAEVLDALTRRWPQEQYLHLTEVGQTPDQGGRKADLLVVSLWRSRGLTVEAVEVKVSDQDLSNELKDPSKADFWWKRSDRFWLAAPLDLAKRRLDDIPPSWGVLGVGDNVRELRKAPLRGDVREKLGWSTVCAMLRSSSGAGANALQRAHMAGYREAQEAAEKVAANRQRNVPGTIDTHVLAQWKLAFENQEAIVAAAGIPARNLVALQKIDQQLRASWDRDIPEMIDRLTQTHEQTTKSAAKLTEILAEYVGSQ